MPYKYLARCVCSYTSLVSNKVSCPQGIPPFINKLATTKILTGLPLTKQKS